MRLDPYVGLAYLLGIQLMPRIAQWKDLKIFKISGESYPSIDPMFTSEEINEDLIAKHLVEMQRVAVSILQGRISPSFILRRLTSGTRKNKLYYAFQELWKVVLSAYLLNNKESWYVSVYFLHQRKMVGKFVGKPGWPYIHKSLFPSGRERMSD